MALLARTALVVIAALSATAAVAQSNVPTLDLTATCRSLDRSDWSIRIDTQRCVKTESEARAKLVEDWAKFPAADRGLCTQTARMGGFESYVQLLTCLELRHEVATGPVQRDPAVNGTKPSAGSPMQTRPAGLPSK
jgi:hypothetical protein